jgi:hypothetical protein
MADLEALEITVLAVYTGCGRTSLRAMHRSRLEVERSFVHRPGARLVYAITKQAAMNANELAECEGRRDPTTWVR